MALSLSEQKAFVSIYENYNPITKSRKRRNWRHALTVDNSDFYNTNDPNNIIEVNDSDNDNEVVGDVTLEEKFKLKASTIGLEMLKNGTGIDWDEVKADVKERNLAVGRNNPHLFAMQNGKLEEIAHAYLTKASYFAHFLHF